VGFLIYGLRKFECASFSVHFSFWGNGGPTWKHEFDLRLDQQDREWTLVTHKHSYALAVRDSSQTKLQHKRKTIFQRLHYPADYHHNYLSDLVDHLVQSFLLSFGRDDSRADDDLGVSHQQADQVSSHISSDDYSKKSDHVHRQNLNFKCPDQFQQVRGKRKLPLKLLHEKDPAVKTVFDRLKFPLFKADLFGNLSLEQSRDSLHKSGVQHKSIFKGQCFKCLGWGVICTTPAQIKSGAKHVTTMVTFPELALCIAAPPIFSTGNT
jgi:hypothetical protein